MRQLIILFTLLLASCGQNYQPAQVEGPKNNFVLGDKVTQSDEFASVFNLVKYQGTQKVGGCSATLVCEGKRQCKSSKTLKSSAHCLFNETNLQAYMPAIMQSLTASGAIVYFPKTKQLGIREPFFTANIRGIISQVLHQEIKQYKIRSLYKGKLSFHDLQSYELSSGWIEFYVQLIRTSVIKGQKGVYSLLKSRSQHAKLDQAVLTLKKRVRGIKIYNTMTPQEVKDVISEGAKVILSGWGINQKDFNYSYQGFGLNHNHPINDERYEVEVKVKKTHDKDNFLYLGEWHTTFGMVDDQNGACMGDSGGGAFLKVNGEYRHIGTINDIQAGLCGLSRAKDKNGKEVPIDTNYHTRVLSW